MHALAQLCVKRPVFATMLILSLVVVGMFSYFSLGVDLFPKVDIPTVQVAISDPGASPEEIETEMALRENPPAVLIDVVKEGRMADTVRWKAVLEELYILDREISGVRIYRRSQSR